jgi:phosphatidylglycerophosphate synthase
MPSPGRWRTAIPSLVTAVRLLLVPGIWVLWARGSVAISLSLYGVAVLSDALDGVAARRLGATTRFGAFFDATSDITVLVSLLLLLGLSGTVPIWAFVGPLVAGAAFLLTSGRKGPRYDPVGRNYGGALFAIVGCILYLPYPPSRAPLCYLIVALSGIVLANRLRIARGGRAA